MTLSHVEGSTGRSSLPPHLTKRQQEIFHFIRERINTSGLAPTFEEIKRHFRLSAVSTVHQHIEALVDKGFLSKEANISRGVQLREPEMDLVAIPLLGTIAAGAPIEAIEEKETIAVASTLLKRGARHYALRVKGRSMEGENIHDGDLVLIKKQETADNGDRVVALLERREATLKTFFREKDRIVLKPANPAFAPIVVPRGGDLKIQGVVVGIVRK
jgi:SOS regulatory protein LexA